MMIVVVAVIVNIGKGVFVRQDIINARKTNNNQLLTSMNLAHRT